MLNFVNKIMIKKRYFFYFTFCFMLVSANKAYACGTFPAAVGADDRVIEMLPDGSGVARQGKRSAAGTPREGMVVYDSSSGQLLVCDGTNWKQVTQLAGGASTKIAAVWGSNNNGQLGNPEVSTAGTATPVRLTNVDFSQVEWKEVSSGGGHTCAIRLSDNILFCWGENTYGELGRGFAGTTMASYVPATLSSTAGWNTTAWKSVSVGGNHTCGIRLSDDRLFCWGSNGSGPGELGNGNTTSQNIPTALNSTGGWDTTEWKSVSAGGAQTCAIRKSDDRLFCWGAGSFGALGTGNTTAQSSPTALNSVGGWDTTAWKSVSVGNNHTCAIRLSDNLAFCWGYEWSGALGNGNSGFTNQPSPVSLTSSGGWNTTAWKSISAGITKTCGIRLSDDYVFCWGAAGSLGSGGNTSSAVPTALNSTGGWSTTAWKSLNSQGGINCAVRSSDDRLFCWGSNTNGQLGDGTTTSRLSPVALNSVGGWDTNSWEQVATGNNHTCAIRSSDKRLLCWGQGSNGELGSGSLVQQNSPGFLVSASTWQTEVWKSVSAGRLHSCGIRLSDDRLFCWGNNANKQLGNGENSASSLRVIPDTLNSVGGWDTSAWKSVSSGNQHTCAIRLSDDRLLCWGRGGNGRLGTGTTSDQTSPAFLNSTGGWNTTAWASVSSGGLHTCAIRSSDNRLFCWGSSASGQLGTGNTTDQNTPTALNSTGGWDATEWKSVSAGTSHTCAIRLSDDRLFCWGLGTSGQLGTGNTTDQNTPTALNSTGGWNTTAWKSVSLGDTHTCAIRLSDNRIFCWGSGTSGRLGTGNTTTRNSPTALNATGGWSTTAWKSVSTGEAHSCAIRLSDDRLFCWGSASAGGLGTGNTTDQNTPTALTSTGGWNTRSFSSVSAAGFQTLALESDPNDCSTDFSTSYNSQDLSVLLKSSGAGARFASRTRFSAPAAGLLSYDRTANIIRLCHGGSWRSFSPAAATSCSSYPTGTGNDIVIEWRADGSGLTYTSNRTLRSTPRAGSMIYNSTTKTLQICDGTNWQSLQIDP